MTIPLLLLLVLLVIVEVEIRRGAAVGGIVRGRRVRRRDIVISNFLFSLSECDNDLIMILLKSKCVDNVD